MAHELLLVLIDRSVPENEIESTVHSLIRPHSDLDDPDKRNPRCDGWIIGGRFDGVVHGAPMEYNLSPKEFQARYGLHFENVELRSNVRAVSQIETSFLQK